MNTTTSPRQTITGAKRRVDNAMLKILGRIPTPDNPTGIVAAVGGHYQKRQKDGRAVFEGLPSSTGDLTQSRTPFLDDICKRAKDFRDTLGNFLIKLRPFKTAGDDDLRDAAKDRLRLYADTLVTELELPDFPNSARVTPMFEMIGKSLEELGKVYSVVASNAQTAEELELLRELRTLTKDFAFLAATWDGLKEDPAKDLATLGRKLSVVRRRNELARQALDDQGFTELERRIVSIPTETDSSGNVIEELSLGSLLDWIDRVVGSDADSSLNRGPGGVQSLEERLGLLIDPLNVLESSPVVDDPRIKECGPALSRLKSAVCDAYDLAQRIKLSSTTPSASNESATGIGVAEAPLTSGAPAASTPGSAVSPSGAPTASVTAAFKLARVTMIRTNAKVKKKSRTGNGGAAQNPKKR